MPEAIENGTRRHDAAELQLLVVMSARAEPEQLEDVLARLASAGARGRVTPGRDSTIIGAIGDQQELANLGLEGSRASTACCRSSAPTSWWRANRRPSRA